MQNRDKVNTPYDTKSTKVIIPEDVGVFTDVGFSMALLLVVIFALFKIRELVEAGY